MKFAGGYHYEERLNDYTLGEIGTGTGHQSVCHDVKQLLMLRKLTITMTVPVCLLPFSFFCLFCLKETIGLDWI